MEGTDILGYLKSRQNELERVNHPMSNRSLNFRYLYSYGVGVLALGSMKSITELQDKFNYFIECIALPKEQRDKILIDINNHFEFRLSDCIRVLRTKEVQYCFLVDLYKLYNLAVWSLEYCEKVIANYLQIFHASEPEIAFFRMFNDAVTKRDVVAARNYYHNFREAGFEISYKTLQYFFPDFEDKDVYQDLIIAPGKTFYLDKPAAINGDIVVERGGSLLVDGAEISIKGAVLVDGGRIQFRDSKVFIEECDKDYFLTIQDAAVVQIENSSFDCNLQCGFLWQNAGRLLVEESEFQQSSGKRMIAFSGRYARILRSSFLEGRNGFLMIQGASQMNIEECDFYQANAEYGGAVYSDTIDNVTIQKCSFRSCKAKYLGAAVYFQYQKLGQVVKECTCRLCEPASKAVFNTYEDDFELKVR